MRVWLPALALGLVPLLPLPLGPVRAEPAASKPAAEAAVPVVGGFRLTQLRVPADQVLPGGPGRDEIPSVSDPHFASLEEATWVLAQNPVLGVSLGDDSRVYPVHIMERHQVVNDVVAGRPIVVTYDPLAGTPLVYERTQGGRVLEFGVAGLVYNANFLLFDRATDSLWSQFLGDALAGPLAGQRLRRVEVRQETLASWLERHPDSKVLAPPSDRIDYRYSPFSSYWISNRIPFPVAARDPRFHAKEVVVGVTKDGKARAYLGSLVTRAGGAVDDVFEGSKIHIDYSSRDALFRWQIPDDVQVTEAYWFAWKAFHPDTEVWNDPGDIGPLEE
jgi:Protein of unknown function (DUF3179)